MINKLSKQTLRFVLQNILKYKAIISSLKYLMRLTGATSGR